MSKYSKEDIFRMVEEEEVEFIRLQFTDIFGMLKNVAITSGQLKKALENRCMFDGSAIEGFVRVEESDMYLSLAAPAGQGGPADLRRALPGWQSL